MQTDTPPPIGSKSRPYRLHKPVDWYRSTGTRIGLSFSREEIEQAKDRGHQLGLKKYRPVDDSNNVEIPAGSYVECYIIRKGIHDVAYHNMKNLGKPRENHRKEFPAARWIVPVPAGFHPSKQLHLYETHPVEEHPTASTAA